jgi:hypothetical protein
MKNQLGKAFRTVCFLIFLLGPSFCAAQLRDSFTDGNFTDGPSWQGSTSNFIINAAGQLQLNN